MDKEKINISKNLYDLILKRVHISNGEFSSIDEYIEFVLSELFNEQDNNVDEITSDEKEKIEEELRKMGYI